MCVCACVCNHKHLREQCSDHKRSYGNTIDNYDAMLDDFVLQPNFKHYDNHELSKLSKHLHQTNANLKSVSYQHLFTQCKPRKS